MLLFALPAFGQEFYQAPTESAGGSQFQCQGGETINLRLGTQRQDPIAAVSKDGRRHILALQPWDGVTPQIVWTDGSHTLTWSAGVRLMWTDGGDHLACGRRPPRA